MCRKVRKKVKTLGRSADLYSNELGRSSEHTDGCEARVSGSVHVTENSSDARSVAVRLMRAGRSGRNRLTPWSTTSNDVARAKHGTRAEWENSLHAPHN